MAKLYLSCLLFLAFAGLIQCCANKGPNDGRECFDKPDCSGHVGTCFDSAYKKPLFWCCDQNSVLTACLCPDGEFFCPYEQKCVNHEEAVECYRKMETLRQIWKL